MAWVWRLGGGLWCQAGSLMFYHTILKQYFPESLKRYITRKVNRLISLTNPYVEITFPEYPDAFRRSVVFSAIESYLGTIFSAGDDARRLKAHDFSSSHNKLVLTMDYGEEIADRFGGAEVRWTSYCSVVRKASWGRDPERRFLVVRFHRKDKDLVTGDYMRHVVARGEDVAGTNRRKKLYTNTSKDGYKMWSSVVWEHPARFDSLAMDPEKKREMMEDLAKFQRGGEYYARIGKAWKRGYLLYGPPGTGKSTMIAAMANFLDYDVYDLELTAVKDNSELRKLLIDISSKSIVVIEDIDCSLDLTGQRKEAAKEKYYSDEYLEKRKSGERVTLSGLLNFIDGIWSACGGERVVVFTTNHVEKLDPALIRSGRMDKHVELSYCRFEAFRVLAGNYLGVQPGDDHESFPEIQRLLGEVDVTPADVAENLMPKSTDGVGEDADVILKNLIHVLERAKEKRQNEITKAVEKVGPKDCKRRGRRFSRHFGGETSD